MKIKLRTQYCSPRGTFQAGAVIDVPEQEGKELIDGRYAERVTTAPKLPSDTPHPAVGESGDTSMNLDGPDELGDGDEDEEHDDTDERSEPSEVRGAPDASIERTTDEGRSRTSAASRQTANAKAGSKAGRGGPKK